MPRVAAAGLMVLVALGVGAPARVSAGQQAGALRPVPSETTAIAAAIRDFDQRELVSLIPDGAIKAIDRPRLLPASKVDLHAAEIVVGIAFGAQAHAYPLRVLAAHETINDEVAGVPVAVTFCPLCFTAVAYDRRVRGQTLTFGVAGKLYRNSLILFDRQTHTYWSHLLGAAVRGPLRGALLRSIPSTFTDWGTWRRLHPHTLAVSPRLSPYHSYSLSELARYAASPRTGILPLRRRDARLPPKALVLGLLAPAAKAYAFRDLRRLGVIRDTLAGRRVEIDYDARSGTAAAFLDTGQGRERLPSTPIFWFAWVDFFPGAPLWGSPAPRLPGG